MKVRKQINNLPSILSTKPIRLRAVRGGVIEWVDVCATASSSRNLAGAIIAYQQA